MTSFIRSAISTLAIVACLGATHVLSADYVPSWKFQTKSFSGEFRHLGGNKWAEFQNGQQRFTFLEMQYKFPYARIIDKSRNVTIELRETKATIHFPNKKTEIYTGAWAGPNLPTQGKTTPPKLATLRLIKLECHKRTSGLGHDDLELRLYPNDPGRPRGMGPIKFNHDKAIGSGGNAVILPARVHGPHKVSKNFTVELWEIDSVSRDDLLGRSTIDVNQPIGTKTIRFTGDGSLYVLTYQLEP